jgi:Holliday junction resolvase RusA-like endonuclease
MNTQESIRQARRALREPIAATQMQIVVPLVPPSVNHYKRPKASGGFFLTQEAKNFKAAVASLSRGSVDAKLYYVRVNIYLGKGDRGDGDNFNKCVGDALVDARIIHSDAKIKKWDVEKFRDREEPRTEILIWPWDAYEQAAQNSGTPVPGESYVAWVSPSGPMISSASGTFRDLRPGRPCPTHGAIYCRQCHGDQVAVPATPVADVMEKKPAQSESEIPAPPGKPDGPLCACGWPATNGTSSAAKLIRARLERRIARKR